MGDRVIAWIAEDHDPDAAGSRHSRSVRGMTKYERQGLRLTDDEGNVFDALWSRSMKHLIVTVARRGDWDRAAHVELTPNQLETVRRFLDDTVTAAKR
jgi:hypothetical protein